MRIIMDAPKYRCFNHLRNISVFKINTCYTKQRRIMPLRYNQFIPMFFYGESSFIISSQHQRCHYPWQGHSECNNSCPLPGADRKLVNQMPHYPRQSFVLECLWWGFIKPTLMKNWRYFCDTLGFSYNCPQKHTRQTCMWFLDPSSQYITNIISSMISCEMHRDIVSTTTHTHKMFSGHPMENMGDYCQATPYCR